MSTPTTFAVGDEVSCKSNGRQGNITKVGNRKYSVQWKDNSVTDNMAADRLWANKIIDVDEIIDDDDRVAISLAELAKSKTDRKYIHCHAVLEEKNSTVLGGKKTTRRDREKRLKLDVNGKVYLESDTQCSTFVTTYPSKYY